MAKRSMMKVPDGMVPRGRTIRLYPTLEQRQHMRLVQDEARHAWNHLVGMYEAKVKERFELAEKEGVIGPRPKRPGKDAPESEWKEFWKVTTDRKVKASKAFPEVRMTIPRSDSATYNMLMTEWAKMDKPRRMTANMYQALIQDFGRAMIPKKGMVRWRPPRRRSDADPMPIRTGTGYCVKPSGEKHRNALVQLPGLGWILGIAHRDLGLMKKGSSVQGVAFTEHTDGWYAAVRVYVHEEKPRMWTENATVEVELGLDTLCTVKTDDEIFRAPRVLRVWQNPRVSLVDVKLPNEGPLPRIKRMPRGRFFERDERVDNKWRESPERAMTRRARHVGDLCNQICNFLEAYREIVIPAERPSLEALPKNERGCPYAMAPGRLWTAIVNRFKGREGRLRFLEEKKAA